MAGLLPLLLAAAVSGASPAPAPQNTQVGGASVRVVATVTILRAERSSEATPPGGLVRHVSRHPGGQVSINFE